MNIIKTPCGSIMGTPGRVSGTIAYKGIRYATAGRWEYPTQVTHWEGVYDATQYGHCSYQPRSFYNEEENLKKIFYYNEFRKGETYTYSEDCLFLNIFTPETAKEEDDLPVLVYIHGGGVSPLMKTRPAESNYAFWKAVMKESGCTDLAAFRALPAKQLFSAWNAAKNEVKGAQWPALPSSTAD